MLFFLHSAKGSTWEDHKYIKRLNGTYYYPDSYKGGRHLPEGSKGSSGSDSDEDKEKKESTSEEKTEGETSESEAVDIEELGEEDIATLATEVIRGNFGNGDVRKELLGKHYQQVQDRVNEILLGKTGSQTVSSSNSDKKTAGERAIQAVYDKLDKIDKRDSGSSKKSEGIDLTKVYSVYSKRTKTK